MSSTHDLPVVNPDHRRIATPPAEPWKSRRPRERSRSESRQLEQSASGQKPVSSDRPVQQPVFLVASVRSGTTLLRLMLDHHPQIAFFHEFPFAIERLPEAGWPDLDEYREYLKGHRIFQESRLEIDPRLDYPELMNSFLRQKRDRDGKPIVGATVHTDFDRLLRIWPDARFIHLLRDGRDVARSRVALGWSGNMYTGVQSWIDAERLWESLVNRLPADRCINVRYESLVTAPVPTLTRICRFLGVAFHPDMLAYPGDTTYQPPDPRLIGQWRTWIPADAVRLAEARIGDMLVDRGYALSGLDRLRLGWWQKRWLRVDDRYHRIRHRWRLYGPKLFFAELAQRLTDPWFLAVYRRRARIRARLHDIERTTLK